MAAFDTLVVGAGHAGLAVSHHLARLGVEHLVLERGRVGESWRAQRWDSFALNTPAWLNRLPSDTDADVGEPADGFMSASAWIGRLEAYAARWDLPVRERVTVTAAEPSSAAAGGWLVHVEGALDGPLAARTVVVASGGQNVPSIPPFASQLPRSVTQLHSLTYRRAADLPPGAVLVVGSGQTGGQISEDLLGAGRTVYLSPSLVARVRRRHRGRDVLERLLEIGYFDVTPAQLPDPAMLTARQPLISGVGRYGHSLSLQWLADRGATLVGRIRAVEGATLILDDTVADAIRFGDEQSAEARRQIDGAMSGLGQALPPLEEDPADEPHPDPGAVHSPERLDLAAAGLGTVIWATGVRGEFGWLPPAALDADGVPVHEGGESPVDGLFILGLPWLTRRGSGIIHGADADAARIAALVASRAGRA